MTGSIWFYINTPQTASNETKTSKAPLYRCDDRTQCAQMTSCAEALFFLHSCKRKSLDKNNNGIPCEQQLCR